MPDTPEYTVGRGKPPVHTQFKKGQSGNPSGKPGPAKLAKLRFRQLIHRALDQQQLILSLSRPKTALESMANRLVADAARGKWTTVRYVLSLLDSEIEENETLAPEADERECEQHATETLPPDKSST